MSRTNSGAVRAEVPGVLAEAAAPPQPEEALQPWQ